MEGLRCSTVLTPDQREQMARAFLLMGTCLVNLAELAESHGRTRSVLADTLEINMSNLQSVLEQLGVPLACRM